MERMIGDARFSRFVTEFASQWLSLDKFQVPDPERQELIAIVESTKDAIVLAPFQEGSATTA